MHKFLTMRPLIVANWKCNPTTKKEARLLFDSIKKGTKKVKNIEVVICPPFVWLPILLGLSTFARQQASYGGSVVAFGIGGQDCFWKESGAFTGEVSARMLKDLGCQYVILGHSERRIYFGETDETINKKIKAVLKTGLAPILCVGNKRKRSKENSKEVRIQLEKALFEVKRANLKNLIIAYEPLWAISTQGGIAASPDDARKGRLFIKEVLSKKFGSNCAKEIRILYGGSVNVKNARDFIYKARMDGLLIGQASLDSREFIKIVKTLDRKSDLKGKQVRTF